MPNYHTFREWPKTTLGVTIKKTFKKPKKPKKKSTPDLLTGLVSYWEMEESGAATRVDSHGSNDLAQFGTPPADVGIVGNGCRFVPRDRLQLIPAPSNMKLTGDKTIVIWYKHDGTGGSPNARLLGVDDVGSNREYEITRAATNFIFTVFDTSGTAYNAWKFPTLVTGDWYFIVCKYDATAGNISLEYNRTGPDVESLLGNTPKTSTTAPLELGDAAGSSIRQLKGIEDESGVWGILLDDEQLDWLYNGGAGRGYSELV